MNRIAVVLSGIFFAVSLPIFSIDGGYFFGDGGKGNRVLIYTSTIENGKNEDEWISQKIKRDLINDFVNYSNIDVIDFSEKDTILKLQKDSESAFYSDENPLELGKAIQAKSYVRLVSTKHRDSFSLSATITNIETGKIEGSFSSKQFSESDFVTQAHGEAAAVLLEQLGVQLTAAGKRMLQYGTFSRTAAESEENLETYKAEIVRLEKEQAELLKNRSTEIDVEAQNARLEVQKHILLQQKSNEEERLARLYEDEKRKSEEERLSKERSEEQQKKIAQLSFEIEQKAAKIRQKKLEDMPILQQIDVIEGEKQILFLNEQAILQNLAAFNAEQEKSCNAEIEQRKKQPPRTNEMNPDGSLNETGRLVLESDVEAIRQKYAKIISDNQRRMDESAGKSQEILRKKIIDDIHILENKQYTADSLLQSDSVYFRVGNYDGSQKSGGWNYALSFFFAGNAVYATTGLLSYSDITGLPVPKYPSGKDPKRAEKIKVYNDYQDNVEAYDSFFRLNVPYIRAVLTYSVKACDIKNASHYTIEIDSIEFFNVQNNALIAKTKPSYSCEYVYNPQTAVNWNQKRVRVRQAKREVRTAKREAKMDKNPWAYHWRRNGGMGGGGMNVGQWQDGGVFADFYFDFPISSWLFLDFDFKWSYADKGPFVLDKSSVDKTYTAVEEYLLYSVLAGIGINKRLHFFEYHPNLYYLLSAGYMDFSYNYGLVKATNKLSESSSTVVHTVGMSFPLGNGSGKYFNIDVRYSRFCFPEFDSVDAFSAGLRFNAPMWNCSRSD